jgi:hypothetical protein
MAQKRRADSNSVEGAVLRTKALLSELRCPLSLALDEIEVFNDIIVQREAASWTRHDMRIAGQLARVMMQIDRLHYEIEAVGYTRDNNKGTETENPALRSMLSLTSTQLQLNKTLGLSASQKGLSGIDQDKRNKADRAARAALEAASEDSLL